MRSASIPLTLALVGALGLAAAAIADGPPTGPAVPGGAPVGAPLDPIGKEAFGVAEAAHLLRRAGFGGTLEEVEKLVRMGPEAAVDALLDAQPEESASFAFEAELTDYPDRVLMQSLSEDERKQAQQEYRVRDQRQLAKLRAWWLERMVRTKAPLRERMTLFWHGHFCSGHQDVKNSYHLFLQNQLFRTHAVGSFRALVHAVAKDPAMLEYLDNQRNKKRSPNENFARELMELFTLGVGNYTEEDIKEAARAFTGWCFEGNAFEKQKGQHDDGEKTVLGVKGKHDGEDVIEIILKREQVARFMAHKLFTYFARYEPEAAVIEGLAGTFRGAGYELRPVLRQLFLSRAFYDRRHIARGIKGPVELVVGLARAVPMRPPYEALPALCRRLGQDLFEPPNVKGWPGDRAWITTSTLLDRYNVASGLVGAVDPKLLAEYGQNKVDAPRPAKPGAKGEKRDEPVGDAMMGEDGEAMAAEGAEPGTPPSGKPKRPGARLQEEMKRAQQERAARYRQLRFFDAQLYVRARGLSHPYEIVDHLFAVLLCEPPSPSDRDVVLEVLERDEDGSPDSFDVTSPDAERRLDAAMKLIVSMPEFQLN